MEAKQKQQVREGRTEWFVFFFVRLRNKIALDIEKVLTLRTI